MESILWFFPVPISVHSSWKSKLEKKHKTNTKTFVATVTIKNHLNPLFESPRACKSMLVSPSVWLQGWSGDRSVSKLSERTSSKLLSMISSIFLGILVMLIASILSSCLVITIIQKYLKLILEFSCLLIA